MSNLQKTNPPITRKTRFVCISDTHNGTPNGAFKLPKGDVLIHAGDLTNQGSFSELQKTIRWIEAADFEAKIIIAGNHDITLDTNFYNEFGLYFHNQNPQSPAQCQQLLDDSPSILWLKHEEATIDLASPTGPRTTFKIFGSPYSPAQDMWAFGYTPEEAADIWDSVPLDVDIMVTHTPAKYHCDERKDRRAVGCEALRKALWRIRPRLAICGHVHESRGAQRVLWDLGDSNVKYKESSVAYWEETAKDNKKISLVDLTKKGGTPLLNDGSVGNWPDDEMVTRGHSIISCSTGSLHGHGGASSRNNSSPGTNMAGSDVFLTALDDMSPQACRGQGGVPPSKRCDLEALSGRMGRKETCIINAAMMASSWPHSAAGGGKRFNKPIVVDIDLPVWDN